MVNDPILFGKIAAANALSDVYAMGGTPLTAMNIVGFPVPLVEQGVLTDVLNGAGSIVAESGAAIVGGHSIENKEPYLRYVCDRASESQIEFGKIKGLK